MGLAYAPKGKPTVLAMAAEPDKPATVGAVASSSYGTSKPAHKVEIQVQPTVSEPPPATIVIAEKPPVNPVVREEAVKIGTQKQKQKVTAGKPLDPKKANPTYHTEKRAYSMDELRRQQMKELEDMMDDMRGKVREKKSGRGMGLW
jgi:hypothetical protein